MHMRNCGMVDCMTAKSNTSLWAKLDINLPSNRKWLTLRSSHDSPQRLYIDGIALCYDNDTDGYIDALQAKFTLGATDELIDQLVSVGLWDKVEGGWQVHDYLDYQESHQDRENRSKRNAENGSKGGRPRKNPEKTQSVSESLASRKPKRNPDKSRVEQSREDKPPIVPQNHESYTDGEDYGWSKELEDDFNAFRTLWPKKSGKLREVKEAFRAACDDVGSKAVLMGAQAYVTRELNNDGGKWCKAAVNWLSDRSCYAEATTRASGRDTTKSEHGLSEWISRNYELIGDDVQGQLEAQRIYWSAVSHDAGVAALKSRFACNPT